MRRFCVVCLVSERCAWLMCGVLDFWVVCLVSVLCAWCLCCVPGLCVLFLAAVWFLCVKGCFLGFSPETLVPGLIERPRDNLCDLEHTSYLDALRSRS